MQARAERAEVTCVLRPGARESGRRGETQSPGTRCGTSAAKSGESLAGVCKSSGYHPCLPWGQILERPGQFVKVRLLATFASAVFPHCLLGDLVFERES